MFNIKLDKKTFKILLSFSILLAYIIGFFKLHSYINNETNNYIIYNKDNNTYSFYNQSKFTNMKLCLKRGKNYICKGHTVLKNYEVYKIDMLYDKKNTKFNILDNVMSLTENDKVSSALLILIFVLIPSYILSFSFIVNMKTDMLVTILWSIFIAPLTFVVVFSIRTTYIDIDNLINSLKLKNIANKKEIIDKTLSLKNNKNFNEAYFCLKYNKNSFIPEEIIVDRNKIKN